MFFRRPSCKAFLHSSFSGCILCGIRQFSPPPTAVGCVQQPVAGLQVMTKRRGSERLECEICCILHHPTQKTFSIFSGFADQ